MTQAEWDELGARHQATMDELHPAQGIGGDTGRANGANNTARALRSFPIDLWRAASIRAARNWPRTPVKRRPRMD